MRRRFGRAAYSSAPATGGTRLNRPLLGEVLADLEVGIGARLDAPEQLEDQPIAVDERRVALFGRQPAERQVAPLPRESREARRLRRARIAPRCILVWSCCPSASSSACAKRSSSHASNTTPFRAPVTSREDGVRRAALRAPRTSAPRRSSAAGSSARGRRPRTSTSTMREEQRLRPAAEQAPVDEPRARASAAPCRRTSAAAAGTAPAIALDQRADVAVEQRVPGDAHEERRRAAARRSAVFRRHARRDRRRRLLQPEPVERVAGPSVRKYGSSPMRGNSVRPSISTGDHALEARQVELHRLHRARQVGDAEDVSSS